MLPTRLASALVIALLVPAVAAAAIDIGPERPLTQPTHGRQITGSMGTVASDPDGFLAIWRTQDLSLMTTRYDRAGQRLHREGQPLGLRAFSVSATWTGSDYVIAGKAYLPTGAGVFAMRAGADGSVIEPPRLLVNDGYAFAVQVAAAGSAVLVTWTTQSLLTQTVSGVLIDETLAVVAPPFVIATRDLPERPLHRATYPDITGSPGGFILVWENVIEPHEPIIRSIAVTGEVSGTSATRFAMPVLVPAVASDAAGAVMAFTDGASLLAVRLTGGGVPAGEPMTLAAADGTLETDLASAHDRFLLIARVTAGYSCGHSRSPADIVALSFGADLRLDRELARRLAFASVAGDVRVAGYGGRFVVGWTHESCSLERSTRAVVAGSLETPQLTQSVSDYFKLSAQTEPALASSDRATLAVWLEARGDDLSPQVYATLAAGPAEDAPQGVRLTKGTGAPARPGAAWDGRRFLVAWHEGGAIAARFLTAAGDPDGEELSIGRAAATPALDVIWTGTTYLISYAAPDGVRGAVVDAVGRRIATIAIGGQRGVTSISSAAGAGEAVIAIASSRDGDGTFATAVVRNGRLAATNVLSAVSTGCVSKCDWGFTPIGIVWTGSQYRVVWTRHHHPAYGFSIETAVLASGGEPIGPTRRIFSHYSFAHPGALVWTGHFYVATVPVERGAAPVTTITLDDAPLYLLSTFRAAAVSEDGAVTLISQRVVDGAERLFISTLVDRPQPRRRAAGR